MRNWWALKHIGLHLGCGVPETPSLAAMKATDFVSGECRLVPLGEHW
jgi:hypothetical protein